ncbi:hypothetical protein CPB86DRAFT_779621 [Serendipita vermifera]|nr:hypothetical protein CPB86DRAFT_779621 [Serendipita vermifera]
MAVSVILALACLTFLIVTGALCLRLPSLRPSSTKAPYALLLGLGLVIHLISYTLIVVNFIILAFLPRRRRISLLSIICASLLRFTPLLLLACILLALHSRLGSLTAAQPENKRKRFRLARYFHWLLFVCLFIVWVFLSVQSRTVSDALNGHRAETKYSLLTEMGELLHAIIFTCMTYSILQLSRKMNGYLLLPDQVLLVITMRIVPLFIVRSIYCLIDTTLPLAIHHQVRLFTPSIAISADGLVWVITFYTLIALANPAANWIGREAAHLVHGIRPVEPATSPTDIENGQAADDQDRQEPNKWSRRIKLLSPFHKHHHYGSTDVREGSPSDQSHQRVPEDHRNGPGGGQSAPLPDVAIINGVAAGGNQVYAQTHPMAPAWLLQEAPAGGKVQVTST